jgi:hypothetical protein
MFSRLIALVACCAVIAGPARADEAPAAVDTSSSWFPWQGVVIGTAVGGVGGYLLAKNSCNSGGTVLSCDGLAVVGAISLALVGALVGGLVQGLLFWPQQPSAPARPLGMVSVSLLPSVSVEGTASLSLPVHY